jgi:hypothetical protein
LPFPLLKIVTMRNRTQHDPGASDLSNMLLKLLTITTFGVLLSACTPSQEEFNRADFGGYPTEYKATVDDWIQRQLIDPDSRKIEYTRVPDRYFWALSNPHYGYLICGNVNSKNRMGGYSGRSMFWAMLRGAGVVSGRIADTDGSIGIAPPPCTG